MIIIRNRFQTRGIPTPRGMIEHLRVAWTGAGHHWFKEILPRHFDANAKFAYRYARRSKHYEDYKQRLYGHKTPLIFTGELKAAVQAREDVRSTSKGADVILYGPKHLYAYRKDYRQPDKAAEIRTFTNKDGDEIAEKLDEALDRQLHGNAPVQAETLDDNRLNSLAGG